MMDMSGDIPGIHALQSPCGKWVACVVNTRLRVCHVQAPERITNFSIRIPSKEVTALKWSDDSLAIAVCSSRQVEIVNLDDAGYKVRVDNCSGGLGRFTSADFLGGDLLLTVWEFGRAKLWNLKTGKGIELGDIKTACDGRRWQMRPIVDSGGVRTLAVLSRIGAEDFLTVHFPQTSTSLSPTKLPTIDAQSLQWSPDGRWLTILDTPTAHPSLHIYTPDGHHFRSYPTSASTQDTGLGVKSTVWSTDSRQLALSRFNGRVLLLNTRTFAPLAMIEHTTTIHQTTLSSEAQAPIWTETVPASGERSYSLRSQPVSPPLSRTKPSTEPNDLGVAETRFSRDGGYLATRDERMLSTVWVWNMTTLTAHAVLIQHNNVRKMHWHPSRPGTLMLDCGEGVAYLFDATTGNAPVPITVRAPSTPVFSWLRRSSAEGKSAILCASKAGFTVLFPERRGSQIAEDGVFPAQEEEDVPFEEGASEDSLMDMLSGRKPLAIVTEPSYTNLDVGTEDEDASGRLEDTFREKRRAVTDASETDPFDDSDIF